MNTTLELTRCPDPTCGVLAEVAGRWTLGSTAGPLVMAQTRCLDRHTFVLPVTWLRPDDADPAGTTFMIT